jgi:hypothetical protein
MAENANNVDLWKGFMMGTLFGLVAAAYARGDFRRLFTLAPCAEPQPTGPQPTDLKPGFRDHSHSDDLKLRREASENAGDPTWLSPVAPGGDMARQAISIERPGGAPGPASAPEVLEAPGHPGRLIDHSDAAQPVRSAARTYKLGSS